MLSQAISGLTPGCGSISCGHVCVCAQVANVKEIDMHATYHVMILPCCYNTSAYDVGRSARMYVCVSRVDYG